MKPKVLLLIILAVAVALCAAVAVWYSQNRPGVPASASPVPVVQATAAPQSASAAPPVPEATPIPTPEEHAVQGTVLSVDGAALTLQCKDGSTLSLDSSSAQITGADFLNIGDSLTVTYHADSGGAWIADYITVTAPAPSPAPTAPPPEEPPPPDTVEAALAAMTLEEKIGQMFLARCPSTDQAYSDIAAYGLGGFMLFGRDVKYETRETLTEKLKGYQAQSKLPMLIAIDEEGGTVNRLSLNTNFRAVPFWAPQDLYAEGGMDLVLSDLKEKAELLLSLGINVNLAPVADVSTNPNDFIYYRTFGQDAPATAEYIRQVVGASKNLGIGTTLKHFPGYGSNGDTHESIIVDSRPLETFWNADLLPFIAGAEAGADSVLVCHNIVNSIDSAMPASLSGPVHGLLRDELGFDGVIMTDDLDMQAIQQFTDWNSSAVTAILAGNDMVLCSNYDVQIPAVIQAVQSGTISAEQIDRSCRRILTWKHSLGLL